MKLPLPLPRPLRPAPSPPTPLPHILRLRSPWEITSRLRLADSSRRPFSTSRSRSEILDAAGLPDRISPAYVETATSTLLSLHWPTRPPRNILLVPKLHAPHVTASAIAFARHLRAEYPGLNLVFESAVARVVHERLPFPVYAAGDIGADLGLLPTKVDLVTTLGGDGTILRAASLFAQADAVPPILSFSMGSLGFLGEWSFDEHKRAWREVYMSGRRAASHHTLVVAADGAATAGRSEEQAHPAVVVDTERGSSSSGGGGDAAVRGRAMGPGRASKILLRNRLRVSIVDGSGKNLNGRMLPEPAPPLPRSPAAPPPSCLHAINELLIHRGPHPHLAIIDIYLNGHFLTEAVADGILVSTPTGSTAYSLSAGGAIVHPLVQSLLITPICARSLSFRPLVLPHNTRVGLRVSDKNRGRELELSIDGKRRAGVEVGMEMRVEGEAVGRAGNNSGGGGDGDDAVMVWRGGVPCVIRAPGRAGGMGDDDGWVGGLNGLLKFNYPFGDQS